MCKNKNTSASPKQILKIFLKVQTLDLIFLKVQALGHNERVTPGRHLLEATIGLRLVSQALTSYCCAAAAIAGLTPLGLDIQFATI
jgi:hypothetical protein